MLLHERYAPQHLRELAWSLQKIKQLSALFYDSFSRAPPATPVTSDNHDNPNSGANALLGSYVGRVPKIVVLYGPTGCAKLSSCCVVASDVMQRCRDAAQSSDVTIDGLAPPSSFTPSSSSLVFTGTDGLYEDGGAGGGGGGKESSLNLPHVHVLHSSEASPSEFYQFLRDILARLHNCQNSGSDHPTHRAKRRGAAEDYETYIIKFYGETSSTVYNTKMKYLNLFIEEYDQMRRRYFAPADTSSSSSSTVRARQNFKKTLVCFIHTTHDIHNEKLDLLHSFPLRLFQGQEEPAGGAGGRGSGYASRRNVNSASGTTTTTVELQNVADLFHCTPITAINMNKRLRVILALEVQRLIDKYNKRPITTNAASSPDNHCTSTPPGTRGSENEEDEVEILFSLPERNKVSSKTQLSHKSSSQSKKRPRKGDGASDTATSTTATTVFPTREAPTAALLKAPLRLRWIHPLGAQHPTNSSSSSSHREGFYIGLTQEEMHSLTAESQGDIRQSLIQMWFLMFKPNTARRDGAPTSSNTSTSVQSTFIRKEANRILTALSRKRHAAMEANVKDPKRIKEETVSEAGAPNADAGDKEEEEEDEEVILIESDVEDNEQSTQTQPTTAVSKDTSHPRAHTAARDKSTTRSLLELMEEGFANEDTVRETTTATVSNSSSRGTSIKTGRGASSVSPTPIAHREGPKAKKEKHATLRDSYLNVSHAAGCLLTQQYELSSILPLVNTSPYKLGIDYFYYNLWMYFHPSQMECYAPCVSAASAMDAGRGRELQFSLFAPTGLSFSGGKSAKGGSEVILATDYHEHKASDGGAGALSSSDSSPSLHALRALLALWVLYGTYKVEVPTEKIQMPGTFVALRALPPVRDSPYPRARDGVLQQQQGVSEDRPFLFRQLIYPIEEVEWQRSCAQRLTTQDLLQQQQQQQQMKRSADTSSGRGLGYHRQPFFLTSDEADVAREALPCVLQRTGSTAAAVEDYLPYASYILLQRKLPDAPPGPPTDRPVASPPPPPLSSSTTAAPKRTVFTFHKTTSTASGASTTAAPPTTRQVTTAAVADTGAPRRTTFVFGKASTGATGAQKGAAPTTFAPKRTVLALYFQAVRRSFPFLKIRDDVFVLEHKNDGSGGDTNSALYDMRSTSDANGRPYIPPEETIEDFSD